MRHARTHKLQLSGPTVHSLYCDIIFKFKEKHKLVNTSQFTQCLVNCGEKNNKITYMYSNLGPLHKNTKSASMKSLPKNGGGGG